MVMKQAVKKNPGLMDIELFHQAILRVNNGQEEEASLYCSANALLGSSS